MHVLRFGNKPNEEVCRGFIFANLLNALYLSVTLWWNVLVANLATNFQDFVAKVKNLGALAPTVIIQCNVGLKNKLRRAPLLGLAKSIYYIFPWGHNYNGRLEGDPKSRNGGMAEWRKMTPNPKTRNGGKWPQILKHGTAENDPKS